jgi:cation:H+ antiporter
MFNIAAIIGISALLFPPLHFNAPHMRRDLIFMFASGLAVAFLVQFETVSRLSGGVLTAVIIVFLILRSRGVRQPPSDTVDVSGESSSGPVAGSIALILLGAGLLTGGAEILVRGAVRIAQIAGVSERVVAITLISAGTGLPELATSIIAGVRKHAGVAVGNIIGSNIFNSLGILGVAALVKPLSASPEIASHDVWWMVGLTFGAVVLMIQRRRRLSRVEGLIIFLSYLVYLSTLLF